MISGLVKNRKKAFTLAEALITLVIIGVIAALTIPGILVNTEQHEYKSALKKALSSLNYAIEMNIALDGYGPLECVGMDRPEHEDSLFMMLTRRMNVVSSTDKYDRGNTSNYAFFTADGMRFEIPTDPKLYGISASGYLGSGAAGGGGSAPAAGSGSGSAARFAVKNSQCSSPGATDVYDQEGNLKQTPCLMMVDVNGDKKPNPRTTTGYYKVPAATKNSRVLDVFPILVTDKGAFPFGVVGQRVLFEKMEVSGEFQVTGGSAAAP